MYIVLNSTDLTVRIMLNIRLSLPFKYFEFLHDFLRILELTQKVSYVYKSYPKLR